MKFHSTRPPPALDHKARGTISFVFVGSKYYQTSSPTLSYCDMAVVCPMSYNISLFIILITKKWIVSKLVCFSFFINSIYMSEPAQINFKMLTLRLVVKIWMFPTLMLNVCLFFVVDYLCFAWIFFKIIYFGCLNFCLKI